ncbi:MAG TPA: hypothetical protein VMF69_27685 [Gemmataceae bacterium]|nr:hypothetical protein [Gemmataceae bacterium]
MLRLWFVAPLLVVGMLSSGFLLGEDKKTDKEPIIVTKQLPANYGKLGLSQKQKNTIYLIRAKSRAEIQELYEKINELREKEKTDCETVLTPEQLAQYRRILLGSDRKNTTEPKSTEAKNKEVKSTKKDAVAKDKKKDKEDKDKNAPLEIKK